MPMNLSRLMLVTSRHQMKPSFERCLENALLGGAALIQLREKNLDNVLFSYLSQMTQRLCRIYGAQLLINGHAEMARKLAADGVHLPEAVLEQNVLPENSLKGVSVHTVENAKRAAAMGADYLIFGSVFLTASHPDIAPAGLEELRKVTQAVSCPVYAIGGISAINAGSCLEAGAYGVAVMSAVWQAADVRQTVRGLLDILI